jgi:hypothetical protein
VSEAVELEHRPVHGAGCPCTRCRGFDRGNDLPVTHGAYLNPLKLEGRTAEIADEIRPTLPSYGPADEPILRLLALTLTRIERAASALERVDQNSASDLGPYVFQDAQKFAALRADLRGWINTARNLANDLGMTPTSRAKLGLDLVRVEDALASLIATGREIRERREAEEANRGV